MARPLAPLLRVGTLLGLGALLFLPSRREEWVPPPTPESVWASDLDDSAPLVISLGLKATEPLEGQKRPPCAPRREREVAGGCWIRTEHTPPCPEGVYEYGDICLVPVRASPKPRTSINED